MMDKVTAYSFGTVEVTATESDAAHENNNGSSNVSANTPLLLTHEALVSRVQPMEAEILRLKSLCLVFAERLAQLEGEDASAGDKPSSEHKNSPSHKSHIQHSPSLTSAQSNSKSGSALKRRLSEEPLPESDSNNNSDARAHKKKRT